MRQPQLSFRYMLRLEDGSDAGEFELAQPADPGEEILGPETSGHACGLWFR